MKKGLFSVSYSGSWGQAQLDLPDFIRKAGELGFDGVLLMAKRPHLSPLDADKNKLDSIRRALDDGGVRLIGLAAYNDFLLQGPAETPIAEMQIAYIDSCSRLCADLGGGLVRIFTGYESQVSSFGQQWDQVVACLREAAKRAAGRGVDLAVQNHHTLAVDSEMLLQLIVEVDRENCRVGYDAWSPYLRGEDVFAGAAKLAPYAIMSIAANYRRYPRYYYEPGLVNYRRLEPDGVRAVSMEDGEIDYLSFFSALRQGGFDGWYVYEMCTPVAGGPALANLDEKASSFIEFMGTLHRQRS